MNRLLSESPVGPMRIGYIVKMFPRLSETFILNEVLELEKQGLELCIFSLKRPVDSVFHDQITGVRSHVTYLPEAVKHDPWRVARGQLHVWRRYPRPWQRTFRNALRRARSAGEGGNLSGFFQACCLIRELGPIQHLHAHYANVPSKIALLVHRLTGVTYSITTHAKDIFQNDPFASPKLKERMWRARFVIANSQFSAGHIRSGVGNEAEIHVVYNGLDLESFPLRKPGLEEPLLLGVGRLVEKKGFGNLISACQLLKKRGAQFSCEIVGTGAFSDRLKEQIRNGDVGDRVRLVGPLPQRILRHHYERARVFVLPCVPAADGDRDILPNVLKEAMAVGVPVLTTRLEGIDELVEDGVNGLLVEPGDIKALTAKLELLLTDAELRQRLAVNARKLIEERFDRRDNFGRLKRLLERAARRTVSAPADTTEMLQRI